LNRKTGDIMPPLDRQAVEQALAELLDPETGRSVVRMEQLKHVAIDGNHVEVTLGLTSWAAPIWDEIRDAAQKQLQERLPTGTQVAVKIVEHHRPPEKIGEIGLAAKSVIAVGSGKGGVGKSTVAASIAYGLKNFGAKVGLMDADVYGPSIPHLLGVNERPTLLENKLQPIEKDGLRVMSMGFLVPPGEAVVWRGPMLHGAITQFLRDTAWGELDWLVIDMPPGTGDIALTLSQLLPLTGAVVVCTPQDVALLDAVKAIAMFRKVHIRLLGMVENMSYFLCPDCGKRYDIFGSGGAQRRAAELDVPFLGEVPIQIAIRERGDAGDTAGNFRDEQTAPYYRAICQRLVREITTTRQAEPPLPSLSVL
jgi:ATP-binding protein involved in chromosome partitioning